jgi:hypothetical protein
MQKITPTYLAQHPGNLELTAPIVANLPVCADQTQPDLGGVQQASAAQHRSAEHFWKTALSPINPPVCTLLQSPPHLPPLPPLPPTSPGLGPVEQDQQMLGLRYREPPLAELPLENQRLQLPPFDSITKPPSGPSS